MDVAATALTSAWLQAVYRTQSAPHLQANVDQGERTMTDVIERALRSGGLDSTDPQWVDPLRPAQQVDLVV